MEEDKIINYDDAIVTEINKQDFKLTINASSFSNEYYTVDYINSIFTSLSACCEICDSAINNINLYFEKQAETENIVQPDLLNIDFLLEGNLDTTINDEVNHDVEKDVQQDLENSFNYIGTSSSGGSYSSEEFSQTTESISQTSFDGSKMVSGKVKLKDNLGYVNVFDGTNTSSRVSAMIGNGSEIRIIGEENNMYKIIFGENLDYVGYISKDCIEINNDVISTEIINSQIATSDNSYSIIYSNAKADGMVKDDLLGNGANIKIISEENNMYKILYGETFNKVGYINKSNVK